MQPTLRSFVIFAAGVPIALGLILWNEALWPVPLGYLAFATLLTLADGFQIPRIRHIALDVNPPEILYIGNRDDVALVVNCPSLRHSAAIDATFDTNEILEPPQPFSGTLRPEQATRIRFPLVAKRRGKAVLHRFWIRVHGPMRLMERRHVEEIDAVIPVVPNIRAVRDAALTFSARDAFFGVKVQYQTGDGSEFDALRDYVPGLDHRSIDWKHSARHAKLVSKEFRTERNHQIVLAFDTGHLMSAELDGIPRLDHAINAGLLLGHTSLRIGDRVGVFGFDSRTRLAAEPFGGPHAFARLLRLSASMDYQDQETNFTRGLMELLGQLKRRSLIVLQTDFVDTITAELMIENLQRLASRHLIIFVTMREPKLHAMVDARPKTLLDVSRSVIADSFVDERRIVYERLRRIGVHCIDAPAARISASLLNRYILIKQQELL